MVQNPKDAERIIDLRKSIDEAAKHANTTVLAFFGLWIFFVVTIANISDGQLLVGAAILVPAFQVAMPLTLFSILMPGSILIVHIYMLLQLANLIHLYRDLNNELDSLGSKREGWRHRALLFPFLMTLSVLAPRHRPYSRAAAALVSTMMVLLFPVMGFMLCQLRFVALHNTTVTLVHQLLLSADCLCACAFSAWTVWVIAPVRALDTAQPVNNVRAWGSIYDLYLLLILGLTGYFSFFQAVIPNFDTDKFDRNWIDYGFPWGRNLSIPRGFKVSGFAESGRQPDLSGRDLRGGVFMDVDFSDADMERTQFQGSWLRGSRFTNAELDRANFRGAYANFARFDGASLFDADFTGAYLEGTDFIGARLYSAHFLTAMLNDADFSFAGVGSDFTGASLERTKFMGAVFLWADFSQSSLRDAVLDGAGIAAQGMPPHEKEATVPKRFVPLAGQKYAASFRGADLTGAHFGMVDFEYADFADFDICSADQTPPTAAAWEQAQAQIKERLPDGASLRAALLKLNYSKSRRATIFPAEFDRAARKACIVSTPAGIPLRGRKPIDLVAAICADKQAAFGLLSGLGDLTGCGKTRRQTAGATA
jgi:uncharacterized protein YjbI with pentapeptide repeats